MLHFSQHPLITPSHSAYRATQQLSPSQETSLKCTYSFEPLCLTPRSCPVQWCMLSTSQRHQASMRDISDLHQSFPSSYRSQRNKDVFSTWMPQVGTDSLLFTSTEMSFPPCPLCKFPLHPPNTFSWAQRTVKTQCSCFACGRSRFDPPILHSKHCKDPELCQQRPLNTDLGISHPGAPPDVAQNAKQSKTNILIF